ncbi:ypt/rab GTPase activating protein [Moesziomyces antarcticus T-34]|uniref:Ypt/rab GTPase activating protein n=1 Tax=Pseudozyma antarctica (strain T-34) TaxID=1151754 RepID=M9LP41_PSEA3|nr:ypt/rab GTPase activating protein [Moesziomyces antarcticus T-34]
MSRFSSTVIDLTEESPPAPLRPRPTPTSRPITNSSRPTPTSTDTHIFDWSHWPNSRPHSTNSADPGPSASSSNPSSAARTRERIVPGSSRPRPEPIVVASDDESDAEDRSFTIVGQSEQARTNVPLFRSLSTGTPASSSRPPQSTSASSLRFHDAIGRGPHSHSSRIPQGFGILGSSPTARHPLLPQQRAAIPSTSTTTARRTSGLSANTANLVSRLGGDWPFASLTFGGMEMIGSLLRGLHSSGPASHPQSAERKVPQKYDPTWTHPYEVQPGFSHSIIEPPVDLDTYFDDKAIVTGPLPDTTPICAGCRHALVTGANEDQRIWVLPCGHVIDGRCIDRLSGIEKESADGGDDGDVRGKGKAKAVDPPEDEPRSKSARTSARTRASTAAAKPTTPKKAKKPKRFECPTSNHRFRTRRFVPAIVDMTEADRSPFSAPNTLDSGLSRSDQKDVAGTSAREWKALFAPMQPNAASSSSASTRASIKRANTADSSVSTRQQQVRGRGGAPRGRGGRTQASRRLLDASDAAASSPPSSPTDPVSCIRHKIVTTPLPPDSVLTPTGTTYRSVVWKLLLDIRDLDVAEYLSLVAKGKSPSHDKIRNDTFRTLATDQGFKERVKEEKLIRLLDAFVWKHNRSDDSADEADADADVYEFSYVQGMNVLAAPFLYTLESEVEAFRCFSRFIEYSALRPCKLDMLAVFTNAFDFAISCFGQLLDRCLELLDAPLYHHLRGKNLSAEIYAFPSVMTLCACTPPLPEVLQLWDFLLAFGVHFNVLCIVAQLHIMRADLLESVSPMKLLRNLPPLDARKIINVTVTLARDIPADLFQDLVKHPYHPDSVATFT